MVPQRDLWEAFCSHTSFIYEVTLSESEGGLAQRHRDKTRQSRIITDKLPRYNRFAKTQFYKKFKNHIKIAKILVGVLEYPHAASLVQVLPIHLQQTNTHIYTRTLATPQLHVHSSGFPTVFCWSRDPPLRPLSSGLSRALSVPRTMIVCQTSLVFDNNKVWRVCVGNFVECFAFWFHS